MYIWGMMEDPEFQADRLNQLMEKRGLKAGQLAYKTGVSQPMINRLQNGERTNVSAVILAKLAQGLGCSVEYLVGVTDNPSPVAIELDDMIWQLIQVARELLPHRLADLIATAEMYRDRKENSALLLQSALAEAFEAEFGEEELDRTLAALELLRPVWPAAGEAIDASHNRFRRLPSDKPEEASR